MSHYFDIRRYSLLILFLPLFFLVTSFKMSAVPVDEWGGYSLLFYLIEVDGGKGFIAYFFGILFWLVLSFIVQVQYNFYSTFNNYIIVPLYLIFVFSLPISITFNPILIVASLLAFVMILQNSVWQRNKKEDTVFLIMFLYSLSSLFFVPILWLFPVILFLSFIGYESKGKFLLNSFFGFLLPYFMLVGAVIIFADTDILSDLFSYLGNTFVAFEPRFLPIRTATIIKNILLIIVSVKIIFRMLSVIRSVNVVKSEFIKSSLLYLVTLTIIAILYCDKSLYVWILPFIPLTNLFFIYFTEACDIKVGKYITFFLLLTLVIDRLIWII